MVWGNMDTETSELRSDSGTFISECEEALGTPSPNVSCSDFLFFKCAQELYMTQIDI